MKDVMGMMKQVKVMQEKMQALQDELAQMEIAGRAGAGLVTATVSGKGDVKAIKIDASLMKPEETEILEDLVVAAIHDAKSKADQAMQSKMSELTGGLPLPPGMKLF